MRVITSLYMNITGSCVVSCYMNYHHRLFYIHGCKSKATEYHIFYEVKACQGLDLMYFFFLCRKHEEDLAKAHQKEVDSLVADHLRETQSLLTEFNRAKELLSDKISALQLM